MAEKNGFLGADCDYSTQYLNTSTFVWLFGDTLVGSISNNVRNITEMPRNSVGLLQITNQNGKKMPTGPIQFFWKYNTSNPFHQGLFSPNDPKHWTWVLIAHFLGKDQLVLFGYDVYMKDSHSPFGFGIGGTSFIQVSNLNPTNALKWRQDSYEIIPVTNENMTIGSASIRHQDDIYIFGCANKTTIITKISVKNLSAKKVDWKNNLLFYDSNKNWIPFSTNMKLTNLLPKAYAPSESTIYFHPFIKKYIILTIEFMSFDVMLRYSSEIYGPFSDPVVIYTIPKVQDYFCYAPKIHQEFSNQQSHLIWSYVCNTSLQKLSLDLNVYTPRIMNTKIIMRD